MVRVPEADLLDRDATMWELRKRGLTYEQIGRAMGVSTKTAHRAIARMGDRIVGRLAVDHKFQMALDLERIDGMIRSIEDLATGRKTITNDEGVQITLPVSLEAQDRLIKLIGQRQKMLGYDSTKIDVNFNPGIAAGPEVPAIGSATEASTTERTAFDEAMELLKEMQKVGVLEPAIADQILQTYKVEDTVEEGIEFAELVEEDAEEETLALPAPTEPPEWIDIDDSNEWD